MPSLEERAANWPEPWKPEKLGEQLLGELVERETFESDYDGGPYEVLTILNEKDGREYSWGAYHTVARRLVASKDPQVGERVAVVYGGLGEAQPGMNPPVRWRLLVDRPRPQGPDQPPPVAAKPEDPKPTPPGAGSGRADHGVGTRRRDREDQGEAEGSP